MVTFSAKRWINTNCLGGDALRPETFDVISSFTLMWNFFEGVMCANRAHIGAFEILSDKISQHLSLSAEIEAAVRFWAARYVSGANFNHLFQGLHFRPRDCPERVEAVLRGEKTDPRSQLLAVMIITYRLRNNLFHGLKTIDTLNEQAPNLAIACRVLAAIVQDSRAPIIIVQKAA